MSFSFHDIATLKLLSDMLLAGSLMYFAWRFLRSPSLSKHSGRIAELEAALKTLIREADQAGRALNDSLMKRQTALEKLLLDLEGTESRVRPIVNAAESLSRRAVEAPEPQPEPQAAPEPQTFEPPRSRTPKQPVKEPARPSGLSRQIEITPEPQAPDFDEVRPSVPSRPPAVRKNIYGEAVEVASAAEPAEVQMAIKPSPEKRGSAVERYKALSRRVEKQVDPAPEPAAAAGTNPLTQVFRAAEEMIRTGKDLEQVAAATRLPLQQVRVLSQLIEKDRAANAAALEAEQVPSPAAAESEPELPAAPMPTEGRDPRLGVLGGMKRQTQVL